MTRQHFKTTFNSIVIINKHDLIIIIIIFKSIEISGHNTHIYI